MRFMTKNVHMCTRKNTNIVNDGVLGHAWMDLHVYAHMFTGLSKPRDWLSHSGALDTLHPAAFKWKPAARIIMPGFPSLHWPRETVMYAHNALENKPFGI